MTEESAPNRRPTMIEVARLAGVSHQTVSRYLRHNGGLKDATRAKIVSAIAELDYRPNLVARSMRTRLTGKLAILMPPQIFSPARILTGASEVAHAAGYITDVMSLDGGAEGRTARMLELSDSGQYEGILSLAPLLPTSNQRLPQNAAVVVSADYDNEMRGIGELADGSPVAELIENLMHRGHRRFLHVMGSPQFASARGRRQVYLDTINRFGLESVGVYEGDWSAESGIEAITALGADSGVTAVIAANDLVAAGVVKGARMRGWRVPDDLSVTGWDDNPLGALLEPSLTTVNVNLEMLGRRAMQRLVAAVREEPVADPATQDSMNTIVWRGSTGTAPTSPIA